MIKKLILSLMVTAILGSTAYAEQEPIAPPVFLQEGTFKVPISAVPTVTFSDIPADSKVLYTLADDQDPITNGVEYKKGIPLLFDFHSLTIKAVVKEGNEYSDTVEQTYLITPVLPRSPLKISMNKVKKGDKKITGKIFYRSDSIVKAYVKLVIKAPKKRQVGYKADVKNGKWTVKLKKKIIKKDNVMVTAYSKEKFIIFEKVNLSGKDYVSFCQTAPFWKTAFQEIK